MSMKKKVLSISLAASLAAVAVVGSSLAYFTDTDEKTNTISVGNVDIVLDEPHWGTEEAEYLYPGEAVAKDPTVRNYGKNPAFVRVKVEWPAEDLFTVRTDYQDGISADWEYNVNDGYYYYKGVLEAGESTDALFDQIVLSTAVENSADNAAQDIVVTAEAVQAQGAKTKWADVQAMTMLEIADWFQDCGL